VPTAVTAHAAELGQQRDQRTGQHRSDAWHGREQPITLSGIARNDLDHALVERSMSAARRAMRRRESRFSIASSSSLEAFSLIAAM
jgi:hypothetical protein